MNTNEKKLVMIFKSFIEKVFVPQLPKMDSFAQKEWGKMSSMLSGDQFNMGELQLYVDTLPGVSPPQQGGDKPRNKSPFYMKNRKESGLPNNDQGGFNPSKTFGGERARMMFPLQKLQEPAADKQKYSFGKAMSKQKDEPTSTDVTVQSIMPTLERLFRTFTDNQNKIDRMGTSGASFSNYEAKPGFLS